MNTVPIDIIASGAEYLRLYVGGDVVESSNPIEETIDSFANLPEGWDYGCGGPLPEKTLQKAREWSERLGALGLSDQEAFPGEREVLLAVSLGNHYFELIIEADDRVSIAYDHNRKRVFYKPHMTDEEALRTVEDIIAATAIEDMGLQWSALGYFTHTNTTKRSTDLTASHFVIRVMTRDYQWSSGTVFTKPAFRLAPTSGTSTKSFPILYGSPQSSGSLIPIPNYLPALP